MDDVSRLAMDRPHETSVEVETMAYSSLKPPPPQNLPPLTAGLGTTSPAVEDQAMQMQTQCRGRMYKVQVSNDGSDVGRISVER